MSRRPAQVTRIPPRRILVAAALLAAVCWPACGSPATAPSGDGGDPLRLSAAITQAAIDAGSEATITFTLENRGPVDLALTFPNGCRILPFVRAGDLLVYPSGGGRVCPLIVGMITLRPGATMTSELRVRAAATAAAPVVPLPRGDYTAYATLDATEHHVTSESLAFTVK